MEQNRGQIKSHNELPDIPTWKTVPGAMEQPPKPQPEQIRMATEGGLHTPV